MCICKNGVHIDYHIQSQRAPEYERGDQGKVHKMLKSI